MKKIVMVFLIIIAFIMPLNTISFAGDVPEALLVDDDSYTFIGEVKEVTDDSVTFVQKHNFKGEFTKDGEITLHVKYIFDNVEVGKVLLCGYLNGFNLYTYEIESFDGTKIKLTDNHEMTKRLENYINNGDFIKAENERVAKEKVSDETINGDEENIKQDESKNKQVENNMNHLPIIVVSTLVLVISGVLLRRKSK